MMAGIRSRNTGPELLVRKALFSRGFRFRLHRRDLPGVPDVVLSGRRVAIFVHGCFWHQHSGCRYARLPATRSAFWRDKLKGNCDRDERNLAALLGAGWRVLMVWECAVRSHSLDSSLKNELADWVNGTERVGEISGSTDWTAPEDHEQDIRSAWQDRAGRHFPPDDIVGFDSP